MSLGFGIRIGSCYMGMEFQDWGLKGGFWIWNFWAWGFRARAVLQGYMSVSPEHSGTVICRCSRSRV